jgi:hypothetical protein
MDISKLIPADTSVGSKNPVENGSTKDLINLESMVVSANRFTEKEQVLLRKSKKLIRTPLLFMTRRPVLMHWRFHLRFLYKKVNWVAAVRCCGGFLLTGYCWLLMGYE